MRQHECRHVSPDNLCAASVVFLPKLQCDCASSLSGTSGEHAGCKKNRQAAVECGEIIEQFDLGITKAISNSAGTLATHGHRPASGQQLKLLELLERRGLGLYLSEGEKYEIGLDRLAEGREI
jgi:hypothetical protein